MALAQAVGQPSSKRREQMQTPLCRSRIAQAAPGPSSRPSLQASRPFPRTRAQPRDSLQLTRQQPVPCGSLASTSILLRHHHRHLVWTQEAARPQETASLSWSPAAEAGASFGKPRLMKNTERGCFKTLSVPLVCQTVTDSSSKTDTKTDTHVCHVSVSAGDRQQTLR